MLGIFKVNSEKFKKDLNELEIIGLRTLATEYINEHVADMHGEEFTTEYATAYTSSSYCAMLNFMDNPLVTIDGVCYEISYAVVLGESRVVLCAYEYDEENGKTGDETIYISN